MHHRRFLALGAAIVVLVAAALALWWHLTQASLLPDWVARSNGRIEMTRTDIAVKYPGRLLSLSVHEGDDVRAGQVIGQLDDTEVRAQLDGAQGKRAQALAALDRAQGERVARDAQARLARLDWTQTARLRARGMVSDIELQQRRLALDAAEAAVQAAEGAVAEARSAIAQADAQIAQLRAVLAEMRIVAPGAGRVEYRVVEPGTVLAPGGRVAALVDPQDTWLAIFVPAAVAGPLHVGDAARVLPQGFGQALDAQVSFVSPEAQFTPKFVETTHERENLSYRVKLRIPADVARRFDGQLKAGMTADGYVRTDPAKPWPDLTPRTQ